MSRTPELARVLNQLRDSIVADLRVALPARVVRWDATTHSVDVQPFIRERTLTPGSEDTEPVRLPVLVNVKVIYPGSGQLRITFPIEVGDSVWVMFSDTALDSWLTSGSDTATSDFRRHHLTDAVCIPGLRADPQSWSGIEENVITIGTNTGASDFVALAAKVDARIGALETTFNMHTHVVTTAPGTTATPLPTASSGSSTASATVKVRG